MRRVMNNVFILLVGIWIGWGMPIPDCIFTYCTEESVYEETWDEDESCRDIESQ